MSSEKWEKYKLGDVLKVKHGFAFKGEHFTEEPNLNILLTPGNFRVGGGFKGDKFKYYQGDFPKEYILKEGEVIVTMTDLSRDGDTLGYSAKIPYSHNTRYLHNQRLGLLQFLPGDFDKDFIYWLLRTKDYQEFIVSSATGSTVKHTSPSRIEEYEFSCPSLPSQRRIAAILTVLDDKIELNRRINETLEGIAQAVWGEWFGKYASGEVELPEGWRWGNILEIAKLIGGGTPKTEIGKYWGGDIPWISAKDITPNNRSVIIETEKSITQEGLKNSSAKLLPALSTIISARGTVGNFCLIPSEMTISQSNYALKSVVQNTDFFLFQQVANLVSEMQQKSYGTVFDTITTKTFSEIEIPIPPVSKMVAFNETMRPVFEKRINNLQESRTLTALRDELLPRLMRGELEV